MPKKKRSMLKPPPVLDCARVLHYVRIDKSIGYAGRTLLFVGTKELKELGRMPCLAICEDRKTGVLLFHCNHNWKVLGCSGHESVVAAKKKAEWIYPDISVHWVAAHVTKKRARKFLDSLWGNLRCTFCGRRPDEVEQLFGKRSAHICTDCVNRFYGMLTDFRSGQAKPLASG
jgi:hypothetical protein